MNEHTRWEKSKKWNDYLKIGSPVHKPSVPTFSYASLPNT